MQGTLRKLKSSLTEPVQYHLPIGDKLVDLNALIGKQLTLTISRTILCSNSSKTTKKSYSQGHCFVCMRKLASCDMCIMKPETCHYDQGTCREPEWGEENCMIPAIAAGVPTQKAQIRLDQLLERTGISHRKKNRIQDLSGGERQRTAICRALMNQPDIILADEPTGALDEDSREQVFELLIDMVQSEGATLLIATHDKEIASRCDRVLQVSKGVVQQ